MNSDIFLRPSKKMLFDKLNIDITDSDLIPIINHAITNTPLNDDSRIYNKEILRFILNYFSNNDTLESAINHLDLIRNQPIIEIPTQIPTENIIEKTTQNTHEISIENNNQQPYILNIPKNNIQYYNTFTIHSIKRNINLYPSRTFFSFSFPTYSKLIPYIIKFDFDIPYSFLSLKINDSNGTLFSFDFWKQLNNTFTTIDNLLPITSSNNNNYTLALYNDYNEIINFDDDYIIIKDIKMIKENYIIEFNKNIEMNKFLINDIVFIKNDDNDSFSSNSSFNMNHLKESKVIPILNNQIHFIFKQVL
jgi:hypothetical protein